MKQYNYLLTLIISILIVAPIEAKKKKYPNGDYYEGEWKKGAPHGIGTMKYVNGDVYIGNWELGEKNGHGIQKYINGDTYDGNWDKGVKSGRGIMKYANKNVYEGNWISGIISGQGTMKYFNGGKYEGNWMLGERSGLGKMKYVDGSIYNGIWENDEINGKGRWDYPNGKYEEGIWENGVLMSGKVDVNLYYDGKYHFDEYFIGEVENGEFYNGKILGTYKNIYYNGILKNGKFYDGFSKKVTTLGLTQVFYSESIQTKASIQSVDGWCYDGKVKDDMPYGAGTIVKDKHRIEITCIQDKYNGILYFEDGTQKIESIPSSTNPTAFNNWVVSAFKTINRTNRIKRIQHQREMKERKEKAEAIVKAHEEEINRSRIVAQIPYYIWEAEEIRSTYENNPVRFRSLVQNKYVIIGGTITDIDEFSNFEYSPIWKDWIEYKYYIVRLSGGVYFESRNANFISGLSKGQELLFVSSYTDKQSFNRPLFNISMYADSTHGIIKLLMENGITLSNLVKR